MALDVELESERYVRTDERSRPANEVDELCGDASEAADALSWRAKTRFQDLAQIALEDPLRQSGVVAQHPRPKAQ